MTYAVPDDKVIRRPPGKYVADEGWQVGTLPPDDSPVEVFTSDWRGQFVIPFPCVRVAGKWRNANDDVALVAEIGGWRFRKYWGRACRDPAFEHALPPFNASEV